MDTRLYLAMSWVEGRSLLRELDSHLFTEAEVLHLAARGLELLVYLHGRAIPVIHRDLKPANLLLRPDGALALVDFGAAREVQRLAAGQATLVGTPGYMPPEQLVGVATPAGDVYALGATLVHLLSRQPPTALMGEELRLEFRAHVRLSKPALGWLERLVHRHPRKRFATAAQALEALRDVRTGRTSRRRVWAGAASGLGVAGVLAAGLSVSRFQAGTAAHSEEAPPSVTSTAPATPRARTAAVDGAPRRITCLPGRPWRRTSRSACAGAARRAPAVIR